MGKRHLQAVRDYVAAQRAKGNAIPTYREIQEAPHPRPSAGSAAIAAALALGALQRRVHRVPPAFLLPAGYADGPKDAPETESPPPKADAPAAAKE